MKTETVSQTHVPVFVAKPESATVELTLDDALARIKELRAKMAPMEKMEKNLIEVAKASMKAKGIESYTAPNGDRALWSESQSSKVDKELAKELLGPEWSRVHSFKTVKSFTVK